MLTLQEHILLENRVDVLWEKYSAKIRQAIASSNPNPHGMVVEDAAEDYHSIIVPTDPTPNKQYLDWLIRQFIKFPVRFCEDCDAIKRDLELYNRVKQRMPQRERDINYHGTYHGLRGALVPYHDSKSSGDVKREEIAKFKRDITTIYDGSGGKLLVPNSYEASKFLGRGTQWCTAMATTDKWYKSYTSQGPLFVVITAAGNKFQLHMPQVSNFNYVDPRHEIIYMDSEDIESNIGIFLASPMHAALMKDYRYAEYTMILAGWNLSDTATAAEIYKHLHGNTKLFLIKRANQGLDRTTSDMLRRARGTWEDFLYDVISLTSDKRHLLVPN